MSNARDIADSNLDDLTVDTDTLVVDSTNNRVGIGTTSPSTPLEISSSTPYLTLKYSGGTGTSSRATIIGENNDGTTWSLGGVTGSGHFGIVNAKNADMYFSTNNSEAMRILSGGGLTFNGDTAAANALDDYEEGTWTPSYTTQSGSFSSITYHEQNGTYVKIGRLVVVSFDLRTNSVSLGTASGSLFVTGLPFNINGSQGTGQCGAQQGWATNSPEYLNLADGSNYGFLRRTDGASYSDTTVSNLTTGSSTGANRILGCSIAYYTNS